MPVGWWAWEHLPEGPVLVLVEPIRVRRERRRSFKVPRQWWPEIEVPPD